MSNKNQGSELDLNALSQMVSVTFKLFLIAALSLLQAISWATPAFATELTTQDTARVARTACFIVTGDHQLYERTTACTVVIEAGGSSKIIFEDAKNFPILPVLKEGDTVILTYFVKTGAFPSKELVGINLSWAKPIN